MAWTSELSLAENFMQPIRQGDVALLPLAQIVSAVALQKLTTNLTHLTLAEGQVTRPWRRKFPTSCRALDGERG